MGSESGCSNRANTGGAGGSHASRSQCCTVAQPGNEHLCLHRSGALVWITISFALFVIVYCPTWLQRVYRGHVGRQAARSERSRLDEAARAHEAQRLARLCQECEERKAVLRCDVCTDVHRFCPQCWMHGACHSCVCTAVVLTLA